MSDPSAADPSTPDPAPGQAQEVEVGLAAFLPDGVVLGESSEVDVEVTGPEGVDLEALTQIEQDLDAVDAAIAALDAGTYGIDPVTGQPVDDAVLAADPTRLS